MVKKKAPTLTVWIATMEEQAAEEVAQQAEIAANVKAILEVITDRKPKVESISTIQHALVTLNTRVTIMEVTPTMALPDHPDMEETPRPSEALRGISSPVLR